MHSVETLETVLLLLGAAVTLHYLAARMRLPPSAALLGLHCKGGIEDEVMRDLDLEKVGILFQRRDDTPG